MDFWELVRTRRSVRKYDTTKLVTDDQIRKIIEAGIWAPSSKNSQCWRFFVIKNVDARSNLISKATRQPFVNAAPVLIVVAMDLEAISKTSGRRGQNFYALQDAGAAIQNMLLAATDLGLASCWVGSFNDEMFSEMMNFPKEMLPVAILPVGYPAEDPKAPPRVSIDEITSWIE